MISEAAADKIVGSDFGHAKHGPKGEPHGWGEQLVKNAQTVLAENSSQIYRSSVSESGGGKKKAKKEGRSIFISTLE